MFLIVVVVSKGLDFGAIWNKFLLDTGAIQPCLFKLFLQKNMKKMEKNIKINKREFYC
jgi:hypothetical protein